MLALATGKALAIVVVAGLSGLAITANLAQQKADPVFSQYEVTWQQWKACYDAGGCSHLPKSGRQTTAGDFPVTGVNRFDVDEYIRWINARGGKHYRLPTADEWSAISNGLSRRKTKKLFDDPRLAWAADYGAMEAVSTKLQPGGSFGTNANGISDLAGNVWEWTSTCATPIAGDQTCPAYIAAGLHEAAVSVFIREPAYGGCVLGVPPAHVGLRLVEG